MVTEGKTNGLENRAYILIEVTPPVISFASFTDLSPGTCYNPVPKDHHVGSMPRHERHYDCHNVCFFVTKNRQRKRKKVPQVNICLMGFI